MLKLEKETVVWKQRWERMQANVVQMTELKEKRDAEMVLLNNRLSTLQELCKAFQRERASLIAQLREKNDDAPADRKPLADENRKSMKQGTLSEGALSESALSESVHEFRATVYDDESAETPKGNKKLTNKTKNKARKKSNQKKQDQTCGSKEIEVTESKSNGEQEKEFATDSEKTYPLEENKIDTSAAEIAILERHETVLKDIEKVLAEQAILEAKIACVKEMSQSITSTADEKSESPIDDKAESTSTPRDSPESEIVMINNVDENSQEAAAASNTPTLSGSPIIEDETSESSLIPERNRDIDGGLSITEFEIVNHGPDPDTATCENETVAVDDSASEAATMSTACVQSVKQDAAIISSELENIESHESENEKEKSMDETKVLPSESTADSVKIVDSSPSVCAEASEPMDAKEKVNDA